MPSPLESPLFALIDFAREHRKAPTRSEAIFWGALRDRRFLGIKFRRQHVLHPYIVDFFAPALKLVVEGSELWIAKQSSKRRRWDGGYHAGRVADDAARDLDLAGYYGARVVRIDAALVERDLPEALRVLGRHVG